MTSENIGLYYSPKKPSRDNPYKYRVKKKYTQDEIDYLSWYIKDYGITSSIKDIPRISLFKYRGSSKEDLMCTADSCANVKKWSDGDSRWERFCSKECKQQNIKLFNRLKKETLEENLLKKYGVINVSQLQDIKNKKEETTLKNYGVKNPFQIPENKSLYLNNQKRKSKGELKILEFIKNNYKGEIISGDRKLGIELDIYLPEIGLAIEYNGMYWHSLGNNNLKKIERFKNMHLKKTKICQDNNIDLIHILEEPDLNLDQILGYINNTEQYNGDSIIIDNSRPEILPSKLKNYSPTMYQEPRVFIIKSNKIILGPISESVNPESLIVQDKVRIYWDSGQTRYTRHSKDMKDTKDIKDNR